MDVVADLADRCRGMSEFQFEIECYALTPEERDEFLALMDQRTAQRKEKLEALTENIRILKLLFLQREGKISALEFVERVRGVIVD